ncbi:MAG: PilZ domain-containing protein [candidate division Zixibacteria bacterium]|nr:PilZ domain-containing protein [candidate division Zixibacteria bacterium]
MRDFRKNKRIHVVSYLKVTESATDETVGRVVDITTEGMRLRSEEPLKEDSALQFRLNMPQSTLGRKAVYFDASVIWCSKPPDSKYFDTGIQLLNVPRRDQLLIEELMMEASYEDRWLSITDSLPQEY